MVWCGVVCRGGLSTYKTVITDLRLDDDICALLAFLRWVEMNLIRATSPPPFPRHKYNLNALSHDTAIGLIQRALDGGVKLAEVCGVNHLSVTTSFLYALARFIISLCCLTRRSLVLQCVCIFVGIACDDDPSHIHEIQL